MPCWFLAKKLAFKDPPSLKFHDRTDISKHALICILINNPLIHGFLYQGWLQNVQVDWGHQSSSWHDQKWHWPSYNCLQIAWYQVESRRLWSFKRGFPAPYVFCLHFELYRHSWESKGTLSLHCILSTIAAALMETQHFFSKGHST